MLKKQETGRSMIEMLGVLAIIGVLSVGGIAGYTTAMRSYRANEIVNATSMLYMLGIAQNQGAGDAEMVYSTHFGANAVPSGASEITYNANKTITLAITDVDICNQVKVKLGDKAGTCTAATSPATGYTLTVTLGDASTNGTQQQQEDPCSQCKGQNYGCSGTDCTGCIYVSEGAPCVSSSNCNKLCNGYCFDDASPASFLCGCCSSPDEGSTCANYSQEINEVCN